MSAIARVGFDPKLAFRWTGAFENWSRSWVAKNHWRVRTLLGDEEDSVQQCAVIFVRVVNRYAATVNSPKWMMGLFKVAVANEWHSMAVRDKTLRSSRDPDVLEGMAAMLPQSEPNYGPLMVRWHEASAELRAVVTLLIEAPAEVLDMVFAGRSPGMTNRRLRRLCGVKADIDLLSEVKRAFQ